MVRLVSAAAASRRAWQTKEKKKEKKKANPDALTAADRPGASGETRPRARRHSRSRSTTRGHPPAGCAPQQRNREGPSPATAATATPRDAGRAHIAAGSET